MLAHSVKAGISVAARADFTSGSSVIPCWSGSGGAALASSAGIGGATAPTACTTAAAAISANTVSALNSIGRYVKGNSALFPPALGTFGNAGHCNILPGFWLQELGSFRYLKDWKFRERFNAQFRAEFFNIFNHPNFANPGGLEVRSWLQRSFGEARAAISAAAV